jgi:hypothetical protein
MKPTIVTAVMLPTRELLYRPSNTRMGDYLAHPQSRMGALLFYPPETRDHWDDKPVYTHERFLLDADTAWHVRRRTVTPDVRTNSWGHRVVMPVPPPRLYATHDHAFVERRDVRRALWVIEHWLEEVL